MCKKAHQPFIIRAIQDGIIGDASVAIEGNNFETYTELEAHLLNTFEGEEPFDIRLAEFIKCRKQYNETVADFDTRQTKAYYKLLESAKKNPQFTGSHPFEHFASELFEILFIGNGNLNYANSLRSSLKNEKCNRSTLVSIAKQEEIQDKGAKASNFFQNNGNTETDDANLHEDPRKIREKDKPWCSYHKLNTHNTSDCNHPNCPKCTKCGKKGHDTKFCDPRHIRKANAAPTLESQSGRQLSRSCRWCNTEGHWDSDCPTVKNALAMNNNSNLEVYKYETSIKMVKIRACQVSLVCDNPDVYIQLDSPP
ncbi:hypothetical protein V9T40_000087 [Parthenolecanium corni]|uniref:CCHC-type domain-containing protein n=1 Tax=Parthenolecanium corni TaxID=536013 RepID=A0AAN9TUX1_9HEMI